MLLKNENIRIGQHCWAISNDELLVVLKVSNSGYQVCGGWEYEFTSDDLEIIEVIEPPKGKENTKLYYIDSD